MIDTTKKGRWTTQEDRSLRKFYNKYGPSWVKIGEEFMSRSSKQCRERWLGYLAPNLKKGPFTDEEATQTYHLYDCFGPQWAKIAEFLPGRTGNMVKNFYHNNQRQNRRIITETSSPLSSKIIISNQHNHKYNHIVNKDYNNIDKLNENEIGNKNVGKDENENEDEDKDKNENENENGFNNHNDGYDDNGNNMMESQENRMSITYLILNNANKGGENIDN